MLRRAAGDDRRPLRRRAQPVPRDGEVPYRPLPPERLYLDRDEWDEMLASGPLLRVHPVRQAGRRRAASMAAARPGAIFAQSGGPGAASTVFEQLREPGRALGGREAPHGHRRLDARLARAPGASAARARLQRRRARPTTGPRCAGCRSRDGRAGHARRSSAASSPSDIAVVGEQDLLGERICAPAAPAQAGRPVHRRGDRDRRGRSGGAPRSRHRPL